jgi:lipoprotein-releasing system permease protein
MVSNNMPFEWLLGWRYTRAGRATRRNGFISFISGVSMLGIALGVAALIIVLSVMNGFQKEVRDRMLAVVSHIEVLAVDGGALGNPDALMQRVRSHPEVVAVAPFVATQALIARGEDMRGAVVRGIDPEQEGLVAEFVQHWPAEVRTALQAGRFGVVLGGELARSLGVRVGEQVTLVSPGGQVTPAGVVPRLKQVTVVGTTIMRAAGDSPSFCKAST